MTELVQRLRKLVWDITPYALCHEAADRIEQLEKLLEISPRTKYDGIDCRDATIKELERENAELRKDAERYRWLKEHNKSWSWQPSRYNHRITSGFAAYSTGYLGFDFEPALDAAMKEQT